MVILTAFGFLTKSQTAKYTIMAGIDLSIFGGNAGVSGGSLSTGDNYARGDFRMPKVFGGVSSRA